MENNFKNDFLSYSRLTRFEQCPLSFKLHYIEKQRAAPGDALRFGSVIHTVLERLLAEVIAEERIGKLSESRALAIYQQEWTAIGLTGIELYQEGLEIIRSFVGKNQIVDHRDLLAIEKDFTIRVGRFDIRGFIDRVDCLDRDTIHIIDYKTNRQLYSKEELQSHLQLSLYCAAAKQLWPWARNIKLSFYMLRHGIHQVVERTSEQIDAALSYLETLGEMTEQATEYPARLNTYCAYCDHRHHCPAYQEALKGQRTFIGDDPADLEAVAKEREEVSNIAKIVYARKKELEDVLKVHLQETDELNLGGIRYGMYNTTKLKYPLDTTLGMLEQASGLPRDQIVERIATVDSKALDKFIGSLGKNIDRSRVLLLKADLEAAADKSYSPRFWAKQVNT